MAKLTIVYGVIFIIMGLYGYFGISSESITALIPAFFGVPMLILGWFGLNEKYLKHTMHVAAVLNLLGFAGTVSGLLKFFKMIGGLNNYEQTYLFGQLSYQFSKTRRCL